MKINSFIKSLHQWIGLICGWFLFLLTISGALALFDKEITQWMQPELASYKPAPLSSTALDQAYTLWLKNQKQAKNIIFLPTDRYPYLHVMHFQDGLFQGYVLNPEQGNILPVRDTAGGYFIGIVHKTLLLNRYWGGLFLLIISLLFLFSVITGVFIHYKAFFKTLFNLQLKASPLRIQLNLHSTIGMFFLPFLLIIGVSAFLFLIPRYLPASNISRAFPHYHQQDFAKTAPKNLNILIQQATNYLSTSPEMLFFTPKEIKLIEQDSSHLALSRNLVSFNQISQKATFHPDNPNFLSLTQQTLFGIHKGRAGGIILRASYFVVSILSAFFLLFGFLYYTNRKLSKSICDRILKGITLGISMATLIGFISLFWINRLLPTEEVNRAHQEVTLFLYLFFGVLVYGLITSIFNKTHWAWRGLFYCLISLCLFLPVLDCCTIAPLFRTAIANHNYIYIGIDCTALCFGLIFLKLFHYIRIKNFI